MTHATVGCEICRQVSRGGSGIDTTLKISFQIDFRAFPNPCKVYVFDSRRNLRIWWPSTSKTHSILEYYRITFAPRFFTQSLYSPFLLRRKNAGTSLSAPRCAHPDRAPASPLRYTFRAQQQYNMDENRWIGAQRATTWYHAHFLAFNKLATHSHLPAIISSLPALCHETRSTRDENSPTKARLIAMCILQFDGQVIIRNRQCR